VTEGRGRDGGRAEYEGVEFTVRERVGAFIMFLSVGLKNARNVMTTGRHDGARQCCFGGEGKFANGAKFCSTTCRLRLHFE
jgi:hypothetical protein